MVRGNAEIRLSTRNATLVQWVYYPVQLPRKARPTGTDLEPILISHQEFVEAYRSARITVSFDAPFAYPLAASRSNSPAWGITGCGQFIFAFPGNCIVLIVLAVVFRNAWLLLAMPAAFLGIAAGAPDNSLAALRQTIQRGDPAARDFFVARLRERERGRLIVKILVSLAIAGVIVGLSSLSWQSPVFLVSAAFLIAFAWNTSYHIICRRALLQLLLTSSDFYEEAASRKLITLEQISDH